MKQESFEIRSHYNKVKGILVIPKRSVFGYSRKFPCVVLSHGLVSSKDSSKYVALSEVYATEGIATCRFDYHGCGESGGNIEETTLTIRIENLDAVVDFVLSHKLVDPERLGILGSSFGGTSCVIKAARDPRVRCMSFWATPHRLDKPDDGRISDITFDETIYSDFASYDVLAEARNVSCALAIHGELDEVVPCAEGKRIYKNVKRPKKIEIIKNADHIFSQPPHREKAIHVSLNWFRRFFLGS
jgi:dipeptidyl aminopeptidase/acylaminoacyl peptidase